MAPLKDTKVVVIGGSSGIGRAVVEAALAQGASVVVSSSNQSKVDATVQKMSGGRVTGEVVDVTDEESIKSFFDRIGNFDHLVYTASGPVVRGFPDIDLSSIRADAKLWGVYACAKYSKPFISNSGSITLTSGTTSERPIAGWTVTTGSAGALVAVTRNLALDFAPVRVNCVAPGYVDTERWASLPAAVKAKTFEETAAKLPVKHIAKPEEVAEAYLFAMNCTYFTGQTLFVDGGSLIV